MLHRTMFDSGVKDLFYVPRTPTMLMTPHPGIVVMQCDAFLQVSRYEKAEV